MAILQGTPLNTNGIHPFVALMASGQQGIDRGIAGAAQSFRDSNATSVQYVRDALQANLEGQRRQLQKEQMQNQKEQAAAQLSLQERQMDRRSSEFQQTLAMRQQEAGQERELRARNIQLSEMRVQSETLKLQREQQTAEAINGLLGLPSGNYNSLPADGSVLPPPPMSAAEMPGPGDTGMPPSLSGQLGYPQQPQNTFVDDFVATGMPQQSAPLEPISPQSEPFSPEGPTAQQPPQASQMSPERAAKQKQILGLKIAAMTNPSGAGYAIANIAKLEGEMAQEDAIRSAGGESNQVANIVNQHVVPLRGLIGETPTATNTQKFWNEAPIALKAAVTANDDDWNTVLRKGVLPTQEGDIPVNKSTLFDIRAKLTNELLSLDAGTSEAKFLAKRQFGTEGDAFAENLAKANPFRARIEKRRDQLDEVLADDMKDLGNGPSQTAVMRVSDAANLTLQMRDTTAKMEESLQRRWKGLGKKASSSNYMDVGGWKIGQIKAKDTDLDGQAFNKDLASYLKEKKKLDLYEQNTKQGLEILKSRQFDNDVDRISEILRYDIRDPENMDSPEERVLDERDRQDFEGRPARPTVPSPMDDWLDSNR